MLNKLLFMVVVTLIGFTAPANAFLPQNFCGPHDEMKNNLYGKPHYEERKVVLKDHMHDGVFEVFINDDKNNPMYGSYTVLRTFTKNLQTIKPDSNTCIVTAGEFVDTDAETYKGGRLILTFLDENSQSVFKLYYLKGDLLHDNKFIMIVLSNDYNMVPRTVAFGNILKTDN